MNNTQIGRNCFIDHAVLDKEILIESDAYVGFGDEYPVNRASPAVLNTGITIIGKRSVIPSGCKIGRNCIIYDNLIASDFVNSEVKSGETVKTKRRTPRIKV
jgi:glucose-1-phosphate adenylyltransferase